MATTNSASPLYLSANATGSLTDTNGNIWTISNGTTQENGANAGYSANVTGLAIVNGAVWQQNGDGLWWEWNGSSWSGGNGIATSPLNTDATAAPAASTATGSFHVSGGQILAPDGSTFTARGIDVMQGNQPSADTLTSDFPGINFVRLAMYDYSDPASLESYVDSLTSQGIVVELEDHTNANGSNAGGGSGQIFSGDQLSNELNWYSSVASYFKNTPYVWFGTNNEPSETDSSGNWNPPALSDWQLQTYNAVRNAGNSSPVLLEANSWGVNNTNSGYNAADYAGMTNTVWDVHYYGWVSGYSTDQGTVSSTLQGIAQGAQQITSADGTMPVIIGEYGNSTTGVDIDANGDQVLQAVQQSGYGNVAWAWSDGNPGDGLTTNGESALSSYGQEVAAYISSNASTASTSAPVMTGTTTPTSAAAAPDVSVDAGSDTLQLVMSEDPYAGDAQFTVSVDGQQVGGTLTTSAAEWAGQTQNFDLNGNWGSGAHNVTVTFLNPAAATSGAQDQLGDQRDLLVNSVSYDGTTLTAGTQTLSNNAWFGVSIPASGAVSDNTVGISPRTVSIQSTGGTEPTMSFITSGVAVTGGSGSTSVTATGGDNLFSAGPGAMDVTGGSGADSYVFTAASGSLTIDDFSAAKGDTLTIDSGLQGAMLQGSDDTGGILLSFGNGMQINLVNTTTMPGINWA